MWVRRRLFGYFRSGQVKVAGPILCTSLHESRLLGVFACKTNKPPGGELISLYKREHYQPKL
jgi:hypothetical protein